MDPKCPLTPIIHVRMPPSLCSVKWNCFDIVRYVYNFKSPDSNI